MIQNAFALLIMMIGGHFVAEFAFQNDNIMLGKSSKDGTFHGFHWVYWMLGHSCVHGFVVGLITHSVVLGVLETVTHFVLDYFKCNNPRITVNQDQFLHIWCKIAWVILAQTAMGRIL